MRKIISSVLLAALALAVALPQAACAGVNITLDHGAVWQTQKTGAATQGFLEIHNTGSSADMLRAWSCPLAQTTLLVGAGGKPLASLAIPAGQTVALGPHGPHLLLQNTRYTVQFGSLVPCALTFQNAGEIGGYLNAIKAPSQP